VTNSDLKNMHVRFSESAKVTLINVEVMDPLANQVPSIVVKVFV
jgi:hypothetical protein